MNEKYLEFYDYLKSENLTDLDAESFQSAYSEPEKYEELWGYVSENNLTDLSKEDFFESYFGGVKKKEETVTDFVSEPGSLVSPEPEVPVAEAVVEEEVVQPVVADATRVEEPALPIEQIEQPDLEDLVVYEDPGAEIVAEAEGEKNTWVEDFAGKNFVTDFFGDMYRAVAAGQAQGGSVDESLELMTKGKDVTDEDIEDFIAAQERMASQGESDEMKEFNKIYEANGKGFLGFLMGTANNPTILPQLFVSSVSAMLTPATLAAGAAGAGTGAAIGATGFSAGPLGVFTTLGGTLAGAMGAMGTTLETGLAFSEFLQEQLEKKGLEMTTEGIRKVLEDPEAIKSMRYRAAGRGITIGAFNAVTAGVGSQVVKSVAKATGRKFVAGLAGAGVEVVSESTGEVAGRLVAGQEMDVAEIGFEGFAGGPAQLVGITRGLLKSPTYKINNETVSGPVVADFIKNAPVKDLTGATLEIKNDPVLKDIAIERRENARMDAIIKAELAKAGITDEGAVTALTKLEKERRGLEGNGTRAAQQRLAEVNKEIDGLMDGAKIAYTETVDASGDKVTTEVIVTKEYAKEELIKDGIESPTEQQVEAKQAELFEEAMEAVQKPQEDAIQEPSPETVDAPEPTRGSEAVGEGVPDIGEPTAEVEAEDQVAEAAPTAEVAVEEGAEVELEVTTTDKKGRTSRFFKTTTEKDGVKTTRFTFNRSDKSPEQRITSKSTPVEEAFGGLYEFEVPEGLQENGAVPVAVTEVRESESGASATVVFEQDGQRFEDEVVLTPKTQEVAVEEGAEVELEEGFSREALNQIERRKSLKAEGYTLDAVQGIFDDIIYNRPSNNNTRAIVNSLRKIKSDGSLTSSNSINYSLGGSVRLYMSDGSENIVGDIWRNLLDGEITLEELKDFANKFNVALPEPVTETVSEPTQEVTEEEQVDIDDFFSDKEIDGVDKVDDNLVVNRKQLSEDKAETAQDERKISRIKQIAKKAAVSLKKQFPDVRIVLHETEGQYKRFAGKRARGAYVKDDKTKTIHINLSIADLSTVPHEVFHALLLEAAATDPQALVIARNMLESVRKVVDPNSEMSKAIEKFVAKYEDVPVIQDEEYLAELMGILSSQYRTLDKPSKNTIKEFLRKLAKLVGIDTKFGLDEFFGPEFLERDEQVIDLLNTISGKVSKGQFIEAADVKTMGDILAEATPAEQAQAQREVRDFKRKERERKAAEDNLINRSQAASNFTDEQLTAFAKEGILFHGSDMQKEFFDSRFIKEFNYGYGFYFTGVPALARKYGDKLSFVDTKQFNLLDGDEDITQEDAQDMLDNLPGYGLDNEFVEEFLQDYIDDEGFENDPQSWSMFITEYISDYESKAEIFSEYLESELGFDGMTTVENAGKGAVPTVAVVWNFDLLNDNVLQDPTKEKVIEEEAPKEVTRKEEATKDVLDFVSLVSKGTSEDVIYLNNRKAPRQQVSITDTDSTNPSFEKGSMKDFSVEGGILEIGKVKGAKQSSVLRLSVDEDNRRQGKATELLKSALNYTNGMLSAMASKDAAVGLNYKLGMRAFSPDGNELSLEETKNQRAENAGESIRMELPDSKKGNNYKAFDEGMAPRQQVADIPQSAKNVLYGDSDVLPKPSKKKSNSQVAQDLAEVAAEYYGGEIITSKTITPEQEETITEVGTEEAIAAFEDSGKSAADWYSTAIEKAMAVAAVIHPSLSSKEEASKYEAFAKEKDPVAAANFVMRVALAITSQNLNVEANAKYANEQFDIFKKTGRFDASREYGTKAKSISSNLRLANVLVEKIGLNATEDFVLQEFNVSELEVAASKALGKNIKVSGLRNDSVNGAALFGPKIGQGFLQNLMGKFDPVTIDLWLRRTWGRWTGDVVGVGVKEERMARLLNGLKEAKKDTGVEVPDVMKKHRVVRKVRPSTGASYDTMSDKFISELEEDADFRDKIAAFAKTLSTKGDLMYKLIKNEPMSDGLYKAFISGEKTYGQTANQLQRIKDKLSAKYKDYVSKEKAKGRTPLKKSEWVKGQNQKDGRVNSPNNEAISARKPEWVKAATSITNDLKPIDIPTNQDRKVITRIVNDIKKRMTEQGYPVTNADVQALLWYPEKDIWAKLRGEKESNLKQSYDDQFIKIAEQKGLGKEAKSAAENVERKRAAQPSGVDERKTDVGVSRLTDKEGVAPRQQVIEDVTAKELDTPLDRQQRVFRSGDLENKAEPRWKFRSSRETGHFGTGFYFFGTKEQADKYDARDVSELDIDKYNLAKATKELHQALRVINDRYNEYYTAEAVDELKKEPLRQAVPTFFIEEVAEAAGMDVISEAEAEAAATEVTKALTKDGNPAFGDSVSTLVMKALGFDGVNAVGTSLDNSKYGTVIYDLKEDVAPVATRQQVADVIKNPDNYGYHGGTLGGPNRVKSETIDPSTSPDMPYTGYYFFSDYGRALRGDRFKEYKKEDERDVQAVDFSKYNLYEPKTRDEYFRTRGYLKIIAKAGEASEKMLLEMRRNSRDVFDGLEEYFFNAQYLYSQRARYKDAQFQARDNKNYLEISSEIDKLDSQIEEIEKTNREDKVKVISDGIQGLYNEWDKQREENYAKGKQGERKLQQTEQFETLLLKKAGFEGVDVRGIESLDIFQYGSTIFDLRPGSVVSLTKYADLLNKELVETGRSAIARQQVLYHVTVRDNKGNIQKKGLEKDRPPTFAKGVMGTAVFDTAGKSFAFSNLEDATKWGIKTKIEKDKEVSIVVVNAEGKNLQEDKAVTEDPFNPLSSAVFTEDVISPSDILSIEDVDYKFGKPFDKNGQPLTEESFDIKEDIAPRQQLSDIATPLPRQQKSVREVVQQARDNNFKDAATKDFLQRKGVPTADIDKAIKTLDDVYARVMKEIDGVITKSQKRGVDFDTQLKNALAYLQGTKLYEDTTDIHREKLMREVRAKFDKKEKRAPSAKRILGNIKDVKTVTLKEKEALKMQLRLVAKTAKTTARALVVAGNELTKSLKEMVKGGVITANQMSSVLRRFSRVDLFNPASIDSFLDYMAKIFADAEYGAKIARIKKLLPRAKKNIKSKIGVADVLGDTLTKLFNVNPTLIPMEMLEDYQNLLEMMGAAKKVLPLADINDVTEMANKLLNAVYEEISMAEDLAEVFANYENKVIKDGKLDYAATVRAMIADQTISEAEATVMIKYKSRIVEPTTKEPKTEAELAEERAELMSAVEAAKVNVSRLVMDEERTLARQLAKLMRTEAIERLSNQQLETLLAVIDNINNGFVTHAAQRLVEAMNASNRAGSLLDSIVKAVPLPVSTFVGKIKAGITKNNKFFESVKRNPLAYIDQVFGDFKTTRIYDAVFKPLAQAYDKFSLEMKRVDERLTNAQNAVMKSFKNDPNKARMSSYKMMAYMLQREFEANPDNKQVNPAADFIRATIDHINKGQSFFKGKDAEMLQQILDDFGGEQIDSQKLYDSFNKAERNALAVMEDINKSMGSKAVFTGAVIRGRRVDALNQYAHHNVLSTSGQMDKSADVSLIEAYNQSMRASTKAKNLIERTGAATPLNFDVFSSVSRGSRFTLTDFYLTEPIRTSRKTISDTRKLLEERGDVTKQENEIINAVENALELTLDDLLTRTFSQSTMLENVVQYVKKTGYRLVLASGTRAMAEGASNLAFAAIYAPKDFAVGRANKTVLGAVGIDVMSNLKSTQLSRMYPNEILSGRMIDTSVLGEKAGDKGGRAKSDVLNKATQIYNGLLSPAKKGVEVVADTLISYPDKAVIRPLWFGSFENAFVEITGKKPDFEKIAANDEAYMAANQEALNKATDTADQLTTLAGAADNPFKSMLRGKYPSKAKQTALLQFFNNFNSFMTRFLIYEYISARTAVNAMLGNGMISKRQGAALLGAVTTRMVVYTLAGTVLNQWLKQAFGLGDEEDEKDIEKQFGQALASTATSLIVGRDFGNVVKGLLNYGVENLNEEFLDELREGDYDPYRDAIAYTFVPPDREYKSNTLSDYIRNLMGPFGPFYKMAEFGVKTLSADEKKDPAARIRQQRELNERLPLELLGNLGLIPLYRDIRALLLADIYKGMGKEKKGSSTGMTKAEKAQMKEYFPEMYEMQMQLEEDMKNPELERMMKEQEKAIEEMMKSLK